MVIDKTITNSIRGALRKNNIENRKQLESFEEYIRDAREQFSRPFLERNTKKTIEYLNKKYHLNFPLNATKEQVLATLYRTRQQIELGIEKVEVLMRSISKEGFQKVTYSLPEMCISMVTGDMGWSYLIVTGIKTNGEKKTLGGKCMDEVETKLFSYERQMAKFITDDYKIDPRQTTSFLGLLQAYIECYYSEFCIQSGADFDLDKALNTILVTMSHYILYSNLGIELNSNERLEFSLMYSILLGEVGEDGFTKAGALRQICDRFFREAEKRANKIEEKETTLLSDIIVDGKIVKPVNLSRFRKMLDCTDMSNEEKDKYCAQMRGLAMAYFVGGQFTVDECLQMLCDDVFYRIDLEKAEAKVKAVEKKHEDFEVVSVEPDEIYAYIDPKRDVVNKVYDLEAFKEMLSRAALSDAKRFEYEAQMRNLINRKAQSELDKAQNEFKSRMDACRVEHLDSDELKLYELAMAGGVDLQKKAVYIDDCVEMLLTELDEANVAVLRGEIGEALDSIRDILTPKSYDNETKVIYYTEVVDKKRVPKLLLSLQSDNNKQSYKSIHNELVKLLGGLTSGDREVLGEGFPCHILFKGKGYSIVYAIIGGTIVIIDSANIPAEYQKIKKFVSTPKFKNFIAEVRKTVASGNIPDSSDYTDQLKKELETSKVLKKEKQS